MKTQLLKTCNNSGRKMVSYEDVIEFWFKEIDPKKWFSKDVIFDGLVKDRFLSTYKAAQSSKLTEWRETPMGRLAEIIVLDQFPRNMFRDSALAFSTDSLALKNAQEAVGVNADQKLSPSERAFLYMPFMHSEELKIHEEAIRLFSQTGLENNLKFEILHKKIIERFGRFPHRNQILGRKSTSEELAFLKEPNSSF